MESYGSLWKTWEQSIGKLGKREQRRSGVRYEIGKRRLGKKGGSPWQVATGIGGAWCYNLVLPPFYFLFPLTFMSHDLFVTWSVTWPSSPDWTITWPSVTWPSPLFLLLIVSQPIVCHIWGLYCLWAIVLFPIVLPCYCPCLYCSQRPIVHLIRTLSHGSCLSSI